MFNRFLSVLILSSFCCCLVGCKASKEEQVIQWVKKAPQSRTDAQEWGVIAYSSTEEWANAGREIEGIEDVLIGLIENPTDEMLDLSERLDTWHVAYALGHVGSFKSVPVLIKVLDNKDEFIWARKHDATSLGRIGDHRAMSHLCRIVSSGEESDQLKISAVIGLWRIGDPKAIPVIENALAHPESVKRYREAALRMLKELREKEKPKEK